MKAHIGMNLIHFHILCGLIVCGLLSKSSFAQTARVGNLDEFSDASRWKLFVSKAGWSIKHPDDWQVTSCKACPDPSDRYVSVYLYRSSTDELISIDNLRNRPPTETGDHWLHDLSLRTVLNPRVGETLIKLNGMRALKVINRNPDGTASDNVYVTNGLTTVAIRMVRDSPSYALCGRILATFRFTDAARSP